MAVDIEKIRGIADRLSGYDVDFSGGGSIHIKKSHRGKFTALMKRTGKSASWYKAHGTPAQKKMAVFALNARKWKHEDGGFLKNYFEDGGPEWNSNWLVSYPEPSVVKIAEEAAPSIIENASIPVRQVSVPTKKRVVPRSDMTADAPVVQKSTYLLQDPLGAKQEAERLKVTVPDRNQREYFSDATASLDYPDSNFSPDGKNRDEIRKRQQELADAGLYSEQLNNFSKDEIKSIQRKLVDKGFLGSQKRSDGTYVEVDGIVGDKTRAAWDKYNVDGVWGSRSRKAEEKMRSVSGGPGNARWSDFYSAKGVDGCARWVTGKYESVVGNRSKQNGVIGDAWTMPKNIVNSGGKMLFNLYDSPEFSNGVSGVSDLKKKTASALANSNIDLRQLRPGDVVGIYYPESHSYNKAISNGTTYNTHVAIVTGYDSDGMPIVEHNMGGSNKKDRADKLRWGSKITVAARPKEGRSVEEYPFKSGESDYYVDKFGENSQPDNLKSYMDSMAGAAPVIGKIYNNADMDAVQRIATGILKRETGYMQNLESERRGLGAIKEAGEKVVRAARGYGEETKSSDLIKFKLATLSNDERKFIGVTSKEDLDNPEKAGRAVELILAKNYDYFVRYAKQNPHLGMTTQDIEDLTALSYNQGMAKLYNITPSKLEEIRRIASSDEILYDIGATDLGSAMEAIPALAPVFQALYDLGMGTRSTSYMNSVRKAVKDEIKRRSKE